jgi:molecular chaperone DnaJ
MADYYEVLGVSRGATSDDIKRAYRRRAMEYHPDRNPDGSAQEKMAEVNKAYAALSDPERRARYDRYGTDEEPAGFAGSPFGGGGGLGDLFDAFFGGSGFTNAQSSGPPRGEDLETTVELAFEEAVFGAEHEVTVRTAVRCEPCGATGAAPGTSPQPCTDCGGTGQVRRVRQSLLGQVMTTGPCGRCGATGQVILQRCESCRGDGRVIESASLNVEVPAGVDRGTRLRLSGRGAVGPRGGPPGDLYVNLDVAPHPRFERHRLDLVEQFPISVAQAALGATIPYETLDGPEELNVARGTSTGSTVRFRGRGVPDVRGRGRGDLIVQLVVETPSDLSSEEEQLLRRLAELRGESVNPPGGFMSRIRSALR